MALTSRLIDIAVQLAPNTQTNQPNRFAESGTDTARISGRRTSVRVENSGAPADGRAQVKVWGMTPSLMNQLATLGLVFNIVPKNKLTISAGDAEAGMATVFSGTIYGAYGDFTAQPEVPFIFECLAGVADNVAPATASSFPGSTDVATIMGGLARQMNLGFENNGVNVKLASPYFSGSFMTQAQKVAEHAGIEWSITGSTLAIWPKGGNRKTPNVPVVSRATGMVGYPAFTQQGIIVKTIFNPQISFGSLVKVESTILSAIATAQGASGATTFPTEWAVNKLDLALDALVPKGEWLSTIYAYNPNYARGILPPAGGR